MRDQILPAATDVYESAAVQLHANYDEATSSRAVWALVAGFAVVLVLLVLTQGFLAVRTRRSVNLGLAGATLLLVVAAGVVAVSFTREQDSLLRAQRGVRRGHRPLDRSHPDAAGAQRRKPRPHRARHGGPYIEDFDDVTDSLGGADGRSGLLGEARAIATLTGSGAGVNILVDDFERFMNIHDQVRMHADESYDYDRATLAVASEAAAAAILDDRFETEITEARGRPARHAADAHDALWGIVIGVALAGVAAAALVLLGLHPRLREYR